MAPIAAAYSRAPGEVLSELDAGKDGLSSRVAEERLRTVGRNELPVEPPTPAVVRFARQFADVLIYILLASAALKAVMGEWLDFGVIIAVAVINALVGFLQEGRAERALDSIRQMLSSEAEVLRDGEWRNLDAALLVPGDVIRVRSGDRVGADARILEETNLQVEESALTGEAVSSEKSAEPVPPDSALGDRTSMVYSGTLVSAGQATAVVTATGLGTEIGRIQQMVARVEPTETPLGRQLDRFGKALSVLILAMAVVMLLIGRVVHDFPLEELISAAIGFAVAAVPEGLPALVTITLALGVQQMAARRAIVRRLPSVETLGAVTTICSDKTGTLTRNEMTVRTVRTTAGEYDVSGIGYGPDGDVLAEGRALRPGDVATVDALVEAMVVCNDTRVVADGDGWRPVGEPTEGALTTLGAKLGIDPAGHHRLAVVPFESAHKLMAVLVDAPDGRRWAEVKGAPDRLLARSDEQLAPDGTTEPIDRARWQAEIDALSGRGLRVLGAARRTASGESGLELDDVGEGLTFLGVVGIVDPPRPEAVDAIAECQAAGIAVTMITGDHAGTARAIAREMGIVDDAEAPVLTGPELDAIDDERLAEVAPTTHVYARTSPEHKIRIVSALQSRGQVVSMTGDGVNDAPALTRADVGVAMGIKGTEATREAADIVLADDNFATIEHAVEEGRRIYDNIRKSVIFLLPTNGAQALVVLVAVVVGWDLPLEPVQILWINLVTAVTLSLALAYEPAEPGLMRRPPRAPGGGVLDRAMLAQVVVASLLIGGAALLVARLAPGDAVGTEVTESAVVTTLALGQLGYLLNCRFLGTTSLRPAVLAGNRVVWLSAGALMALQLLFVYAPFMNDLFDTAPLGWVGWGVALGLAVAVFLAVEAFKALQRRGRVGARPGTMGS